MSLCPQTVPPVPEQTARIARLAFPKGNLYLQIRDEIGVLLRGFLPIPPKRTDKENKMDVAYILHRFIKHLSKSYPVF